MRHYEKIEKWLQFRKYVLYGKISNYNSPKFGSLVYPTSHLCVVLHFLMFDNGAFWHMEFGKVWYARKMYG